MHEGMQDPGTRAILDAERQVASDRVQTMTTELEGLAGDSEDANGDDEHDPEGSTLAYERARVAALLGEAESTLVALDRAVAKLAAGTYGVCEGCREMIPRARLAALPPKTLDDELVKGLDSRLQAIQQMVSFPNDHTPTQDDIKKLNAAAADLIATITSKK